MSILEAIVYGIVQGLGEFLPISSSAHLTILPWLLGWEDPGLAFDVALHVGTLLSLLIYFRADLVRLISAALASVKERRIGDDPERKLAWMVVIGSVPGAAIGFLLEKRAEEAFRAPWIIATAMLVMGILLFIVDRSAKQSRTIETMGFGDAVLIGLSQAMAIVPGVSRSGATITAARGMSLDRQAAARFSFLLAIPIVAGAALLKVPKLLHSHDPKLPLLIGIVTAAVSGYLALDVLLKWVRTRSYLPFVIYRVLFAVGVFSLFYARGH